MRGGLRRSKVTRQRTYRVATIKIPHTFSILDDPVTAIGVLEDLRRACSLSSTKEIHLDHSACTRLGLCASVVMDVLLLRAMNRRKGNTLNLSGTLSNEPSVAMMIKATGILLPQHQTSGSGSSEACRGVDPAVGTPLRHPCCRERSRKCDIAATRLTDYFNDCLRTHGFELAQEGLRDLSGLVTEVIGNAEEHGGHWYTIGFYRQQKGTSGSGECHIVIFNFGQSIYETSYSDGTSADLQSRIRALADRHRKRGFFGLLPGRWSEEALWTLYALQEGVSRFSFTPRGRDRGNGTIDMISFFLSLAARPAKMCLLSGRAYILFDGKFAPCERRTAVSERRRVIAFNKENNLKNPRTRGMSNTPRGISRGNHKFPVFPEQGQTRKAGRRRIAYGNQSSNRSY